MWPSSETWLWYLVLTYVCLQEQPVTGLEASTTGYVRRLTTPQTLKPSTSCPFLGGSTFQNSLTFLTQFSLFYGRNTTICLRSMLFITVPFPSFLGSDPNMPGAEIQHLGACGTPWCTWSCTPTTSLQHVDPTFKNTFADRWWQTAVTFGNSHAPVYYFVANDF